MKSKTRSAIRPMPYCTISCAKTKWLSVPNEWSLSCGSSPQVIQSLPTSEQGKLVTKSFYKRHYSILNGCILAYKVVRVGISPSIIRQFGFIVCMLWRAARQTPLPTSIVRNESPGFESPHLHKRRSGLVLIHTYFRLDGINSSVPILWMSNGLKLCRLFYFKLPPY